MATNEIYFLLENNKVIGWRTDAIDKIYIGENQEQIKLSTTKPDSYIGLTKEQMYEDPLPVPAPDDSYKETLAYKRNTLKVAYFELHFTDAIGEDTTAAQADYDAKLLAYNDSKEP